MRISQMGLVSAILKFIQTDAGVKGITQRQMNSVIEAANIVVGSMAQEYRPAKAGMGINAWLGCDEIGMSSKYMAHVLAVPAGLLASGRICDSREAEEKNYPHDPSDFGRCLGLLLAVPEIRPHIHLLANGHGPQWASLANNWDRLEALYHEELPTGQCYKLLVEMDCLFAEAK